MNILYATSEAIPFLKTGGLADVAGSLARALRNRRQACRIVMPLYGDIPQQLRDSMKFLDSFYVQLGWRNQYCGVFEATVDGVKYYLLDNEYYFNRMGIYGFYDDAERFAFFSKAALEMIDHIDFQPEIIHCNDWQTAMIPVYLNVQFRHRDRYRHIKTVFTIHNMQYQGEFDLAVAWDVLGLDDPSIPIVEYNGNTNLMKGAFEEAELVTTVSPTYAREILDPWFAYGLDGMLQAKSYKIRGILNGLDYTDYDPKTCTKIKQNYSVADPDGKAVNKQELQRALKLKTDKDAMLIGVVSRLVSHKGISLIQHAFGRLMEYPVQFVLLGSGDQHFEKFFQEAAAAYPGRVSVTLGFDDVLAHKIYAGADVFLMPSKSEPCGLAQMIALRFGTIPIVRLTGGLIDTITDVGDDNGNGYTFLTFNADDMLAAIVRALNDYKDREKWQIYMKNAMKTDYSWGKSATAYIEMYKNLLEPQG